MKIKSVTTHSDQGPYLKVNEDRVFYDIEKKIFAILDGFGGSGIGDKLTKNFEHELKEIYQNITLDKDATLPFFYSSRYLLEANALINSILSINEKMFKENMSKKSSERGGASAIMIAMSQNILNFVGVGNCRAYLIRESNIHKIILEDSFEFLSSSVNKLHLKSIPSNAFGLYSDVNYQVKEIKHKSGDKFIITTDGLYSNLRDEEFKNIFINENISSKERIESAFSLSNERGNMDNQSCMLLEF